MSRMVCRFSCGAASAVATKLILAAYPPEDVVIVNAFIKEEHEDNRRFLADQRTLGGSVKEPNKTESPHHCGIGPVAPGIKRFLKRVRSRLMRRYARQDQENTRPKARHRGWVW